MGLVREKREITKEQYERAMERNGRLTPEDFCEVFTMSERCGYGVYGAHVFIDDGKYVVAYEIGTSCD